MNTTETIGKSPKLIKVYEALRGIFTPPFPGEAAVGVALLLAIYFMIGVFPAVAIPFVGMLLIGFLAPVLNIVWFAAMGAVSAFGTRQNIKGLAWSPVVFCILWFGTSVLHRTYLSIHALGLDMTGGPPPIDLRDRTLSVLGTGDDNFWWYRALLEGKVARIVLGSDSALEGKPQPQDAITYARGEACRQLGQKIDDRGASYLKNAGRADECFITSKVVNIPDGLIIQTAGFNSEGYRTKFILRDGSKDTVTGNWRSNGSRTLSYLPLVGLSASSSIGIWQAALGGPIQQFRNGPQTQSQRGAAIALFGDTVADPIPPELDIQSPGVLDQALSLAQTGQANDRLAALRLATTAWRANNVTDVTYEVMAAYACDNRFPAKDDYTEFRDSRNRGESLKLLRKIFDRAGDPRFAQERLSCDGALPAAGDKRPELETAAKTAFAQSNLGIWQYEVFLKFLRCLPKIGNEQCDPKSREDVSHIFLSEVDPQITTRKAVAMAETAYALTDDEVDRIANSIHAVPDAVFSRTLYGLEKGSIIYKYRDKSPSEKSG